MELVMAQLHIDVVYRASPDSVLRGLSRGMLRLGEFTCGANYKQRCKSRR